jgi:hypothetical protein
VDAILAAIEAAMNEQQKKAEAAQAPARASVPPPVVPQAPPAPPAAAPVRPVQVSPPAQAAPQASPALLQGMFEDGNSLLRAIIAAEVLGPPSALKEHHFWNRQPNEPST